MSTIRPATRFASTLLVLGLCSTAGASSDYDEATSNVITGLIPLGAYAVAYYKGDEEGQRQWMYNTGANVVITSLTRLAFQQTDLGDRPNGHKYGFPSGHMSFVISGASFLHKRYGWQYGLPAYALSAYVAGERVEGRHHHWRDIIAGTAMGWGITQFIVTPYPDSGIQPLLTPDQVGLSWQRRW